jgi:hypothetical protein
MEGRLNKRGDEVKAGMNIASTVGGVQNPSFFSTYTRNNQ